MSPIKRPQLSLALAASALAWAGGAFAQPGSPGRVTPAEVSAAAASLRSQLPMRVDEVTTAVGIRADGAEFVYEMRVDDSVSRERFLGLRDVVETLNQTRLCAEEAVASFIRRGGSMRHIYTNSAGDRFETRIARCP